MNTHPIVELLETRLMLSGTTYVVNSLADTVANDGHLTLREAIQAANTDTAVNEAPAGSSTDADTITFDPALFASGPATITLSGTELDITESLTIQGPGADTLTIDAASLSRVFNISGAATDADLDGLTITGGAATDNGGGIYIDDGTVTLTNDTITRNSVTSDTSACGGGIYVNGGTVTLNSSTVSENSATLSESGTMGCGGGGIYINGGAVTLTNDTITGNSVTADTAAYGGGIDINGGTVALNSSTINGNSAILLASSVALGCGGGGISISGGTVTMNSSTVTWNSLTYLSGRTHPTGGGICMLSGTVTLINSKVTNNNVSSQDGYVDGGGVYVWGGTLTLTGSEISGNSAANGGGVFICGGILTLTSSTISDNRAENGGGISISRHFMFGDPITTVTFLECSITSNTAADIGGGVYVQDGLVTLANSVIAGNNAGSYGGGLFAGRGNVTLTNCTVSGNSATSSSELLSEGGGIYNPCYYYNPCKVTCDNSIIALNWSDSHINVSGLWSGRGNLVGGTPGFVRNPSAGPDGVWGTADDDAGDLHLLRTSHCIDRGRTSLAVDANSDPLTTDIEGNARVIGSRVDIGAYEFTTWHITIAGHDTLHFIDADGTPVTITYKGAGSVTIDRTQSGQGPASQSWGDISSITIDGSDTNSSLTITTKGRGAAGLTNLGQVAVNGPIKAISAGKANLTGDLTISYSILSLILADVSGATISIGEPVLFGTGPLHNWLVPWPQEGVKIKLGQAQDVSLTSQTSIKSLTATDWLNTDGQADVISAPWIGDIKLTGAGHGRSRIAGDFGADLTLTDTDTKGRSLRSFKAAGAVTGGTWALAGGAKSITMGSSAAAWVADFGTDGGWADVDSIRTTAGDLCGQITARSIDRIRTKGRQANITITLNPT